MEILFFTIAVALYFSLHSLLAYDAVKAKLRPLVPDRYYRLGYNLLAISLFVALAIGFLLMEKQPLWSPNELLPYPGALLVLAGVVWMARAMKGYDLAEFTGLQQWRAGGQPRHNTLQKNGLNAKVRHPLYFGTLLTVWGLFFIFPTDGMLAMAVISTSYLFIGSRLEEKKLVGQFGETYRKYQREVPMLIPFRWKRG